MDFLGCICNRTNIVGYRAIIPGFGLPGISGIILVVLGAILAMGSVTQALMSVSVAIIITTLITLLLIKRGSKALYSIR